MNNSYGPIQIIIWTSELHIPLHMNEPPPHFHPAFHPTTTTTTTMPETPEIPLLIDQFNDSDDEFIEQIIPFIITTAVQASQNTERIRPFSSNNLYVNELLTTAHPQRCWDVLRMTIETFYALRDWLLANTSLKSSRNKAGISIEEKIVIFLYIVAHGASAREACERFSYSIRTILR
jgi:hypothetical protein